MGAWTDLRRAGKPCRLEALSFGERKEGRRGTPALPMDFWHWLTTTRYTRLLEERVLRLEAENAHLRNAIYARAGVGPVPLGPAPPAAAGERRTPHPATAGRPLRRPISWSQVKQKLESAALRVASGAQAPPQRAECNVGAKAPTP